MTRRRLALRASFAGLVLALMMSTVPVLDGQPARKPNLGIHVKLPKSIFQAAKSR